MGTNGDYWGLNFMGATGKTIDVIPQVSKSSHYLPLVTLTELIVIRPRQLWKFRDVPMSVAMLLGHLGANFNVSWSSTMRWSVPPTGQRKWSTNLIETKYLLVSYRCSLCRLIIAASCA